MPPAGTRPGRAAGRLAGWQQPHLLHESVGGSVSADDLDRAAGASRFAVYRAFQRRYGMPPGAYPRQLRLRAARWALSRAGRWPPPRPRPASPTGPT